MQLSRMLAAAAAALALTASAGARADWPEKPLRIVVPTPAGGASDATGRLLARHLQDRLKQTVIVENKAGASSNIGAADVARSAPDGYTLLLSGGPFAINPSLFRSLPFDTVRDFTAVAQIANIPSVLVVHPSVRAATVQEFLALARDASRPLAVAIPGSGSAQHLALELLRKRADLSLIVVPYKGGAPALNDVLGGQVAAMMSGFPEVSPHIRSGKLRALAVTTPVRSPFLPEVPTLVELGLAASGTAGWNGVHAPAGTPEAVLVRLHEEINAVLAMPEVRQRLESLGFEVQRTDRQAFAEFVRQQMAGWKEAVALSGAKAD